MGSLPHPEGTVQNQGKSGVSTGPPMLDPGAIAGQISWGSTGDGFTFVLN
ncbi:MAG: hypothetical protein ACRC8Y_08960 [Chroococcales cyanobacterium]